jgi:hypothetical protein
MARSWWPVGFERTTEHGFRIILDEMVGLGVLRKNDDGTFTLRNQNLLLLMGTADEVAAVLLADRDLPEEFAAAEFHPSLEGSGGIAGRHPLTMAQLGTLSSRGSGCVLIGGSPAAGIDRLFAALGKQGGDAELRRLRTCADDRAFSKEICELFTRVPDGTTVALVAPESPLTPRWIDAANDAVRGGGSKRHVKVVFVMGPGDMTSPEMAELAGRSDVVWQTLAPWSDGFVRHWLEENAHASGPDERTRLKRRTEFWPLLLESTTLKTSLSCFVGTHAELKKIVEVLAGYAGKDVAASLGAQDLAALADLPSDTVHRVLKVGERIGVLVPAERGTYRCEPGLVRLIAGGTVGSE